MLLQHIDCMRETCSVELQQTQGKLQAAEVRLKAAHDQTAAMVLVQQAAHKKCTELEQQARKMQVSPLVRCLQSCGSKTCCGEGSCHGWKPRHGDHFPVSVLTHTHTRRHSESQVSHITV